MSNADSSSRTATPPVTTGSGTTAEPGGDHGEVASAVPPRPTRQAISRASRTWTALAIGLVLVIAVLVFILQNLRSARVHFFTATWTIPLGVDLLLATVFGGGIVFALGSIRILQLRRAARPRRGRGRSTPGA